MSVEEILSVEKNKKVEKSKVPLFSVEIFFLRVDRVQGGFFTKITFPKGFWIPRKTDGGEDRGSEPFEGYLCLSCA